MNQRGAEVNLLEISLLWDRKECALDPTSTALCIKRAPSSIIIGHKQYILDFLLLGLCSNIGQIDRRNEVEVHLTCNYGPFGLTGAKAKQFFSNYIALSNSIASLWLTD